MKNYKIKLFSCLMLALAMVAPICLFSGCENSNNTADRDEQKVEDVENKNDKDQDQDDKDQDKNDKDKQENDNSAEKINKFFDSVSESQKRMDIVADAIYQNWYQAVYKKGFSGSIDLAIAMALNDNSENIDFIKENEKEIQSYYKEVRDSELKDEVKAVMTAYSDYYEFVINVSGSFQTYSENMENYKKALATALKHLSLEL